MTKEQLLHFYNLYKEIGRVERTIFSKEFYEGNGFVRFEKLRGEFWKLYKLFDDSEYDLLGWLDQIVDDDLTDFDFGLLTEEQKKELTSREGYLSILKQSQKNYPNAIVKFNTIEEAIDYILTK